MAGQRVKLWDWPVRVIHWSLVLAMPALWWTWKSGQMFVHVRLGYAVLALIVFRLFWGLVGSSPARFASFVRGPRAIAAYLGKLFSKKADPSVGHNPLGGLSVLALLALILGVVGTGLFCEDTDGLNSGPLNYLIQGDLSEGMAHWHHLLFNILLGFVALHLLAILFYAGVKRENLVGPMITGRRTLATTVTPPRFAPAWRVVVGVGLALGVVWWVSLGAPLHLPHK